MREIVYIGGGRVTCAGDRADTCVDETLDAVAEANVKEIPIQVIGILVALPVHDAFLKRLVAESGGGYHHPVW